MSTFIMKLIRLKQLMFVLPHKFGRKIKTASFFEA